jgi:exodeoxyribonuclease-5
MFSEDQADAINRAERWYRDPGQRWRPFVLRGGAGTGKTSVAQAIAQRCAPGRTLFLAPTGKAVQVLAAKGCTPAATIHSSIYHVGAEREEAIKMAVAKVERLTAALATGHDRHVAAELVHAREWLKLLRSPQWTLREQLRDPTPYGTGLGFVPDLLVVDESSMVDPELAGGISSFGIPTVALGDPYQLPPVSGRAGYPQAADVTLSTIHRYGESAPLLDLATAAREGKPLPEWTGPESTAGVWRGPRPAGGWLSLITFDQIIVGTNRTRWAAINAIRTAQGRKSGIPEVGDPIMALRNDAAQGAVNGQLTRVGRAAYDSRTRAWVIDTLDGQRWLTHVGGLVDQAGQELATADRAVLPVTFAHAITAHKSQGSEWPSVAVVDESGTFRDARRNWLYTAVTRASARCLVLGRPPA